MLASDSFANLRSFHNAVQRWSAETCLNQLRPDVREFGKWKTSRESKIPPFANDAIP
jgi:hypothetical protein